jgi:hypothetical protein
MGGWVNVVERVGGSCHRVKWQVRERRVLKYGVYSNGLFVHDSNRVKLWSLLDPCA